MVGGTPAPGSTSDAKVVVTEINYLTSTFAPASVSFFLIVSASALGTPSFTVLGAPSTRSLASLRPRFVTSRTALMTPILFVPASLRMTVTSVCASAAAAGAAAPAGAAPATATGAALTPHLSSSSFVSPARSSTDILERKSTTCSFVTSAIVKDSFTVSSAFVQTEYQIDEG